MQKCHFLTHLQVLLGWKASIYASTNHCCGTFLFSASVFTLQSLLAIYSVSEAVHTHTHWWAPSLDECCNCVDSVDRDFLVLFFSYFIYIHVTVFRRGTWGHSTRGPVYPQEGFITKEMLLMSCLLSLPLCPGCLSL